MPDKSLFDKGEHYTPVALYLDRAATEAIRPVVQAYLDQGYGIREIMHVVTNAMLTFECELMLDKTDHVGQK